MSVLRSVFRCLFCPHDNHRTTRVFHDFLSHRAKKAICVRGDHDQISMVLRGNSHRSMPTSFAVPSCVRTLMLLPLIR